MKYILLLMFSPIAFAVDTPPRWGHIAYDLNTVEYTLPKCQHSKIKSMSLKKKAGSIVIRLECEPVKGEVNRKNPDLY